LPVNVGTSRVVRKVNEKGEREAALRRRRIFTRAFLSVKARRVNRDAR